MRSFIISIVSLLILMVIGIGYSIYSDKELHSYISEIEENIIISVENEDWQAADNDFAKLSRDWHKYKKIAAFFLQTDAINDTDYSIARAKYYIKSKDVSNASGELSCLKEQLTFLHFNETISPQNIF